jgi:hypothetical protein
MWRECSQSGRSSWCAGNEGREPHPGPPAWPYQSLAKASHPVAAFYTSGTCNYSPANQGVVMQQRVCVKVAFSQFDHCVPQGLRQTCWRYVTLHAFLLTENTFGETFVVVAVASHLCVIMSAHLLPCCELMALYKSPFSRYSVTKIECPVCTAFGSVQATETRRILPLKMQVHHEPQ